MSVREWLERTGREGGTPAWLAVLLVKIGVELGASILAGRLLTPLLLRVFGMSAFETYYGVSAFRATWLVVTALFCAPIAFCSFVSLSRADE